MGAVEGLFMVLATVPAADTSTEIIVTGEKRPTPLQQTTTSVSVTSGQMIEDRSLSDVQSLYERTANVSGALGSSAFSIRGIVNYGVTGGGEASTATVYLDDIPLASTFLQAAPTSLWDVERVEIFRGPQSTVQGLNSLAGAVVIRTTNPSLDHWGGRARMTVTSEPQIGLAGAVGGPIIKGELAFRIAAEARSRDGYIRNVTRNTGEDHENSATVRAKLLWRPAHWPGFSLRLGYIHAARQGPYFTSYARTNVADLTSTRIATDNTSNTTELLFDGVSLNAAYDLKDGITLHSDSTWSRARETDQFDGDYGPANEAYSFQQRNYRTFTQEVRLTVNRPGLRGVLGLFFYDRRLASTATNRTSVPTPVGTIVAFLRSGGAGLAANSIASAYGAALPNVSVDFNGSFPTSVRTYAAYADVRLPLAESISLIAGFRAEREENDTQTIQRAVFAGTYPSPVSFGLLAPVITQINGAVGALISQANGTLPISQRTFDTFLPKGGIVFGLTDRIEAAFVAQEAYRSGGTSGNIARGQVFAYDSEYTWNYEASLRSSLLGGRMHLNANAFYVDWRNQQVAVNFGLNSFDVNTVNAGKSHLYGIELEADYRIKPQWLAYLSLGHTRTYFDDFAVPGQSGISSLSGSEFPFAPRWTFAGGIDARLTNGWGGSVNAVYASVSFGAAGINQSAYRIAPHAIANLRLGYAANSWSAHLTCANLFDEQYIMYKSPVEHRAILNAPRTVGIEIAARY